MNLKLALGASEAGHVTVTTAPDIPARAVPDRDESQGQRVFLIFGRGFEV